MRNASRKRVWYLLVWWELPDGKLMADFSLRCFWRRIAKRASVISNFRWGQSACGHLQRQSQTYQ